MICEICKKIFKTFSSLKKHVNKNHINITFEKYCLKYLIKDINEQYCELCGEKKRFIGKENLMYKQYCGICAKKSESFNQMPTGRRFTMLDCRLKELKKYLKSLCSNQEAPIL